VDAGRAPQRVLTADGSDEFRDLGRNGMSAGLPGVDLLAPEQTKSLAMPADHGRGLNDSQAALPTIPRITQPSPEQAVGGAQLGAFHGTLKNADLVPQGNDFKLQSGSAAY